MRAILTAILLTWAISAHAETGLASWYDEGQLTATGARYNPEGMTAAHRKLPMGTVVRVTDLDTGRSVVVTINDRGPYIRARIIDLSRAAARALGILNRGTARVSVERA